MSSFAASGGPERSSKNTSSGPSGVWFAVQTAHHRRPYSRPIARIAALVSLFLVELVLVSVALDTDHLVRRVGLVGLISDWGPSLLRAALAFATLYAIFGFLTAKVAFLQLTDSLSAIPISWRNLGGHIGAMTIFIGLSVLLFRDASHDGSADLIAAAWLLGGVTGTVLGTSAFVPLKIALDCLRTTGVAATLAALGSVTSLFTARLSDFAWPSLTAITFHAVGELLRLVTSDVVVNPASLTIGTGRFQVNIIAECSGLEGAGLMLVFGVFWLCLFRREYRFPRALVTLPIAVLSAWCLNAVRIAALILIGDSGAERIALGGFHSQAGWIAFNLNALGLAYVLHHATWLRTQTVRRCSAASSRVENPTSWYLTPLLTILGAAMVTGAATAHFDWLYPIRPVAAALALWCFRGRYADLDWRFGRIAPAAGIAVFCIWLALDRVYGVASSSTLGSSLSSLPTPALAVWITFRTFASTVTVPVAEELAFRGYLLRRLISPEFERVIPRPFNIRAIAISSVLFGMLHGDRWIAGMIAGGVYATVYCYRGRFGDAVAAHAVTNALLSAWVLATGEWQLW